MSWVWLPSPLKEEALDGVPQCKGSKNWRRIGGIKIKSERTPAIHLPLKRHCVHRTMICNPYEIIIQGITSNGRTFRPSDWAERLSGILSSFGADKKMSYHSYVRPLMLDNVRCVAVDKKLEKIDPKVFVFLMSFARDNDLRIVDCRTLIDEVYPNQFLG